MKIEIKNINNFVECCLVYIDDISSELEKILENNFLEIVKGKLEAERSSNENCDESIKDATRYIYKKVGESNRVGIIGEILFHSILRIDELANKYLSVGPTIGYSDCYQGFYKGFDGCYYKDKSIWIVEVKSKIKSTIDLLNKDNKDKADDASKQIKKEVNDLKINRWEKAKQQVRQQLSEIKQKETDIFNLLSKPNRTFYNQMIGTLLICENGFFDLKYITDFVNTLLHENIEKQKLLLICIRSFDYEKIIEFIKIKFGKIDE